MAEAIKRNWKTTILGISILFAVGAKVWSNPALLAKTETYTEIAAGAGLIVAKDAK